MVNVFVKLILTFGTLLHTGSGNFTEKPSHREHKVHNIVLYPDKHSWCTTTTIVQVVGHPGCNSVKVDNNVCVGACFSYIVPRTVPETPGDVLPYCDSCQPGHVSWKKVTLECTEGNFKNQNLTKYVEFIHNCNCGTCKDQKTQRLPTEEDLEAREFSFESSLIDDYSLNGVTESNNSPANSSHVGSKTMIAGFLNKLNNENESVLENTEVHGLHRNVWKNLLDKVESMNNSMDPNVFPEIVKTVEEELKVKFNYKRLKQALLKLKKYKDITKANVETSNNPKVLMNDTSDSMIASGLYKKISPKLPPSGIEQESVSPMLDVAHHLLKPATSGSEITYHDNLESLGLQKASPTAGNLTASTSPQ